MENMKEVMENDQGIDEFCEYDFRFHRKIIDYLEKNSFPLYLHLFCTG